MTAAYARAVRAHWFVVVVTALVGALALGGYAKAQPARYPAETRLIAAFGPQSPRIPSTKAVADDLGVDRRLIQARVRTYTMLANGRQVTDTVVAALRLPYSSGELANRIKASTPLDTTFIDVQVIDTDPQRAVAIAGAVTAALAGIAEAEVPNSDPASILRISVHEPPRVASRPLPTWWGLHLAAGLVSGFAVGVGLALLRSERSALRKTPSA